jgi:hypothetical protein
MNRTFKTLALLAGTAAALAGFRADAGHRAGNGGDFIRASFLQLGQAVVQHLKDTPDGRALVKAKGLDVGALEETLTIDVVKVSDQALQDNGDSLVDALGEPGKITLSHDAWADHLERERDVYFLVFHEMLRAAGVQDDDYVVSGAVRPFPETEKVSTTINTAAPLVGDDDVQPYIDINGLAVNGSGCPSGFGALADFDPLRNVLGVRLSDLAVRDTGDINDTRKNCTLSIKTRKLPAGKRLVVTQIDALGELDLPEGTSYTLTAEAHLVGQLGSPQTKTVTAGAGPVAGRTLLRSSGTLLQTECGAAGKLLNIAVSGRVAGDGATGRVTGAQLYLRLKGC